MDTLICAAMLAAVLIGLVVLAAVQVRAVRRHISGGES